MDVAGAGGEARESDPPGRRHAALNSGTAQRLQKVIADSPAKPVPLETREARYLPAKPVYFARSAFKPPGASAASGGGFGG